MMATLADDLPANDSAWAYEFKWDGVRTLAFVEDGRAWLQSRNLLDVTAQYPEVADIAAALGRQAILDGEIVALGPEGRPSFQRLQRRMHVAASAEVERRRREVPVAYLVFDVLELDGDDVTGRHYSERRQVLEGLGLDGAAWQVPPAHAGDGHAVLEASRRQGLEGVIAKRLDSTYEPGKRTRAWLKIKHHARQELVIGGWHPGTGNREGRIGALLVGYHDDDGRLLYAGNVGTGFTDRTLADLAERLEPLRRDTSPFVNAPRVKNAVFVEPVLVAEVEFNEWTDAGTLRQPSYKGLREDKDASEVRREEPVRAPSARMRPRR